jgi:hypothetical protein
LVSIQTGKRRDERVPATKKGIEEEIVEGLFGRLLLLRKTTALSPTLKRTLASELWAESTSAYL